MSRPVQKGEPAVQAGSDAPGDQRRFNENGAGPAHWVGQWHVSAPPASQQHCGGQRLPKRSFRDRPPVATQMQQRSGAVGALGAHVAQNPDDEQLLRLRLLLALLDVVLRLRGVSAGRAKRSVDRLRQTLGDGVAVVELGLSARYAKRHRRSRRDDAAPRDPPRVPLELVECPGVKLSDPDHDPAGSAQPEIRAHQRLRVAGP